MHSFSSHHVSHVKGVPQESSGVIVCVSSLSFYRGLSNASRKTDMQILISYIFSYNLAVCHGGQNPFDFSWRQKRGRPISESFLSRLDLELGPETNRQTRDKHTDGGLVAASSPKSQGLLPTKRLKHVRLRREHPFDSLGEIRSLFSFSFSH